MAVYISNDGTSIPDSYFNCPGNDSGPAYSNIPFNNLSLSVFGIQDTVYAGIKGPHPRMAYCCENGSAGTQPPEVVTPIALARDHCTQYCAFFGDLNLWLYCLTREGDLVQNAFSVGLGAEDIDTSGSLPRDGPFDPNSDWIKDYKRHHNGAGAPTKPSTLSWALLTLLLLAATCS